MQASTSLLVASLGAIAVLMMLYVYIFISERKLFFSLWFIGWAIIALNYSLDAFFSDLLRQSRSVLLLSLSSYFYANLTMAWGTLLFLKLKSKMFVLLSAGGLWAALFLFFLYKRWPNLYLIQYTHLAVFAISFRVGAAMIGSAKRYGIFACFLGLLNIAWGVNTIVFSYILKMPQIAPYIVSQIIPLISAIGLIQLFFKDQKDEISSGLEHITYLTFHDQLTGLYNKAYFDKTLKALEHDDARLPVSVLIGDMNGLKFVNDVFGHQEGDQWLKRMALIIAQSCRQNDIAARWGGDEFAIILPNTDKEMALAVGRSIKDACKNDRQKNILISISLGVATKTAGNVGLSDVLKEAEEAMYAMKLVEGKRAKWEIAQALSELLQTKGYESQGHIQRLESLAQEFAHKLQFSKENLNYLLQAVRIHDIGKIGMPEEIALKPSSLSESECETMQKHVEIGYRIAHAIGEFAHLADVILYHHEWWNGQGYPHGLKEESIPLLSRIISILDAFDVMTHNQPYKSARSINRALDELRLKAGTQFDPVLISVFIKMLTEKKANIN